LIISDIIYQLIGSRVLKLKTVLVIIGINLVLYACMNEWLLKNKDNCIYLAVK